MPAYEPDKPHNPGHPHKPHDKPHDKPQDEKTAGDLRKEDAEAEVDSTTADKQGVQDEADSAAMEKYKSEQLAEHPPESDPLKDREARRTEDKKHHDTGQAQQAREQKQRLAEGNKH